MLSLLPPKTLQRLDVERGSLESDTKGLGPAESVKKASLLPEKVDSKSLEVSTPATLN